MAGLTRHPWADGLIEELHARPSPAVAAPARVHHLAVVTEGAAAETEGAVTRSSYRFGAARAYRALVERRVEELRETRIEGFQSIGEFMDRRFTPAMRTCETTEARLESLAERVNRATQMLRARIEVTLAAQNRDLLASMNPARPGAASPATNRRGPFDRRRHLLRGGLGRLRRRGRPRGGPCDLEGHRRRRRDPGGRAPRLDAHPAGPQNPRKIDPRHSPFRWRSNSAVTRLRESSRAGTLVPI